MKHKSTRCLFFIALLGMGSCRSLQAQEVYEKNDSTKPLYLNAKTNMLYDALLIPNIGWRLISVKDGRLPPTGCTAGGTMLPDTGTGVPTGAMWLYANGWEVLQAESRSPVITLAYTDKSSPTTSRPEGEATWVESPVARCGTR